ncbi:MAG: kelch repeat-containing protein [Phycisphaerales bacterium]
MKTPTLAAALCLSLASLATGPDPAPLPSRPVKAPLKHWSRARAMPSPRSAHAVASDDDAIYVVGGVGGPNSAIVRDLDRFDARRWTTIATLPGVGLNAPAAAILDGKLYVIGGFRNASNIPLATVRVYDLSTGEWSEVAPLPAPRGGHAAVVLDGHVHVFGGGNNVATIATHSMYDPAADTWTDLAPLPRAEGSPAGVVYQGAIWAIGGRSGFDDFGDVYIYDAATDTWANGPAIPPRGTVGAAVYHGAIHVFGGESQAKNAVLDDVLRLDPDTLTWSPIDPLPTPRNYARAAILDDAVYIVGGNLTPGASHGSPGSDVVERYHD